MFLKSSKLKVLATKAIIVWWVFDEQMFCIFCDEDKRKNMLFDKPI